MTRMMKQSKERLRRCVGCGQSFEKGTLLRVVRTAEGTSALDLSGKKNGRGAYLCRNKACLERAKKTRGFERSLHTGVPAGLYVEIEDNIGQ